MRSPPESPAEALHELRKQCKKLRYLMEFFQSLFPKEQIKQLIKILKGLQDNLGEHQDLEVQEHTLKDFSKEMMVAAGVPAETLLAMGILVQDLDNRRQCARDADRFAEFETREHHNDVQNAVRGQLGRIKSCENSSNLQYQGGRWQDCGSGQSGLPGRPGWHADADLGS